MNTKLVLQDIVELLAKKTSLNKKEADTFFREFFAAIIDNVFNGEPVKIKDLGTFKLITVDSRETVNVNTGERIVIPAHAKISFVPDKTLKALVNKPFAHFEIAPLKDDISFDIEESEEPAESQDEDTAIDETEIVTPIINPVQPETKIPEEKTAETPEQQTPAVSVSQSFVYTYTSGENEDENASITIVVPADNIANETPASVFVTEQPEKEEKETTSDTSDVQEKIDLLKGVLAMSQKKEPEPVAADKEDIDEKPVIVPVEKIEEPVIEKTTEPELPVDDLIIEKRESIDLPDDNNIVFDTIEDKQENIVSEPAPKSEDNDDFPADYEYQYTNYDKQTAWTAIQRRLPIILFLLAIIGVGSYLIYSIIEDNKQMERRQGMYYNFPQTNDSLSTENGSTPVLDDSLNTGDSTAINPNIQNILPPPTNAGNGQEENTDETSLSQLNESRSKNGGIVVSEHLKITVPNKAAYMQSRKTDGITETPIPATKTASTSALTETIKPGSSLLSIAERHYGNKVFWVYIYEENKEKIGQNYDNISAGDIIIIPVQAKYEIDANNPASIAKAKEKERTLHASSSRRRR